MHYSTLFPLAALAGLSSATYSLVDDYGSGTSFFDGFTFYTGTDPTAGYVTYVDQSTATSAGLIKAEGNATYIGVDHTNVASGSGRQSVRLESNTAYTTGLFILDLAHMPASACGSWPAFWTYGPDWPNDGEIDIIEGANLQSTNQMTLHTSDDCTINDTGFAGTLENNNCYAEIDGNEGCDIVAKNEESWGATFNSYGGGVYAMEWTDDYIQIFWWIADDVPSDITSGSPDPSGWGTPAAYFAGDCDISSHFKENNIVFDITFCGDWAGSVWSSGSCASYASTCDTYVQENPSAFSDVYWLINSLKVYQS
ncbi:hypothetical protein UA08_05268 [Talaromyces atroroseus]|uniref:endo-1,3(4)-beta-glucanase n=1 Tax=Talaromyces atroroseus TaxID=1441469 RepID=A0A225AMW2_TALAT|nr:hypothetical protein UA08_05268 [Talaromyces atroroseus]OKL59684.1 hypothetical protein UA08_05268 [Talaromyces atroroseus]